VSVSVGVSCGKPGDGLTGAQLVDAADQAPYQGKRDLGRNAVAMADQLDPAGPPNVPRLQDGAARVEATGS
jgi:hypothetical protein